MRTNILHPQFPKMPAEEQIIGTHDDFTLEVCMSNESKNQAFKIRYNAYLKAGMIRENETGLLSDEYDLKPNARTFLVWHKQKPVATVRSCIYSEAYNWLTTEAVRNFHQELNEKLEDGSRLLESNRFAVDPEFQGRKSLFARFLLFQAHGLNAAAHQCEYIITSVVANHAAFYQRFLNLHPISENLRHVDWLGMDVALLINRTEICLESVMKRGMPGYDEEDIAKFAMCALVPLNDSQQKTA